MDRDVTADPEALAELQDVIGRMATPTIVIGDEVLLGFAANRARIEKLVQGASAEANVGSEPEASQEDQDERQEMEETIIAILKRSKTVAIVGLSPKPERDSLHVAKYLQAEGYRVIPVNPTVDEVLGQKSYPDLASVPEKIDLVDIFRRPEHIPSIVEEAIAQGIPAVWMQLGIRNQEAAERARSAGLLVVMDRCINLEHARLKLEGVL